MTDSEQGFTLLEVLIALTITAMVLGGLFTLAAGSKQLAVRTQDTLTETAAARAAVNFAMLDNQYREIQSAFLEERYNTESGGLLEDPLRRTQPMNDLLESYQLLNPDTGEQITGVRWVRSDLPR